jgi:hypothetical protein
MSPIRATAARRAGPPALGRCYLERRRDSDDLAHPVVPGHLGADVHDQVDARRHGRDDERRSDVLAGQQRQGAHLHHRLAGAVRVQRASCRAVRSSAGSAGRASRSARGPVPARAERGPRPGDRAGAAGREPALPRLGPDRRGHPGGRLGFRAVHAPPGRRAGRRRHPRPGEDRRARGAARGVEAGSAERRARADAVLRAGRRTPVDHDGGATWGSVLRGLD